MYARAKDHLTAHAERERKFIAPSARVQTAYTAIALSEAYLFLMAGLTGCPPSSLCEDLTIPFPWMEGPAV